MAKFAVETTVNAPIETVFAVSSDFANADQVIEGITGVEMLTDGPTAVGTRFRETRKMFGQEASETMEIVGFDPPRHYALSAESHGARYYSEFNFTEAPSGTQVEMTFEATPLTFLAKVMTLLTWPMTRKLAAMLLKDLNDVKAAAESRASSS